MSLGEVINRATALNPFIMGIVVSVSVGCILTLPISSAALCISIGIGGLAGQGSVILVIMLTNDEVVNKLIKLPVELDETDLKLLSALLNATMTGIGADEFTPELLERGMVFIDGRMIVTTVFQKV